MDTDFDLLDRWRGGDTAAGQALLARHFEALCSFFESKCGQDADDLVQRTMLACVGAKDRFRKHASFRTFLFAIARHELYHYLSARRRNDERLDFSVTSIEELLTTPRSRMIKDADKRRVVEALRRLSVEQQTLLELHYWQELDIEALSEVLEIEPGTTRVRLHRARKKLRELLELRDGDDEAKLLESMTTPRPS
ncbi:MAG TPA: sigma-70 family RNA polymerase sigma factor [Kofleriaceae bacterium]|nr:sigma-70 family RNA polymerase sigma factor [Kofleriaceae bacterium]